eukprot:COSAG04_NODE_357_length_16031_cov_6.453427_4_plen_79_part_00
MTSSDDDFDMDGAFCKLPLSLCVAHLLLTDRILLPQHRATRAAQASRGFWAANLPPLMTTKGLHPRQMPKQTCVRIWS